MTLDKNYPSLGLPGVYRSNGDGTFEMDSDIPLAFYDVRMDDGVTVHLDFHAADYNKPEFGNVQPGQTHPEWWGQSFFKHFPNHGFVGDIFTVNGTAFPVLYIKPRQYRFRCLDASISGAYQFQLMSSRGCRTAEPQPRSGDTFVDVMQPVEDGVCADRAGDCT